MVKRFTYDKKEYTYEKLAEAVNNNKIPLDDAIAVVQRQRAKGKVSYEDENDFWNILDDEFSTIKIAKNSKWRLGSYKIHERQSITEFLLNKIQDFHDSEILSSEPESEEE